MNPSDTPRRQLLRQEEQEEGVSSHRPDELEEESMDTCKDPIVTKSKSGSTQRPHIMTSCNSTSTSTTNTTSSSSSASKHCEMRLKHRRVIEYLSKYIIKTYTMILVFKIALIIVMLKNIE